jgi:signal transduction histidine kinase
MGRNFPSPICIHPMRTEIGRPNSSIRVPPDPGVHRGLRRFGTDPRASPIPEAGPRELRSSIGAFNAIQAQIQNFVDDRTAMLAAISHDLRTPLTKIRLRGEFVEDEEQRARLFRDVDDMQAMVDLALAFFRDDFQGEETTAFDFPEMLRTIVDDYNDQGSGITCDGAEHVPFRGRPVA